MLAAAILGGCAASAPVSAGAEAGVAAALRRGTDYLLTHQNRDGSWGGPGNTKDLNVYAPVPEAHHSFRVGVTALCAMALLERERDSAAPPLAAGIDRAEEYLSAELPKVRRCSPDCLYNIWAHAYGLQALGAIYDRRPADAARRARIGALMRQQIDFLRRFEGDRGGWGYYDFVDSTQKPSPQATSFTTATVLVALHDANSRGLHVPRQLVDRGRAALLRLRNPDFTYLYSDALQFYPGRGINRPPGSLGRSQACNYALRLWGDQRISDDVLDDWLTRLWDRNGWLSRARKMPVPHESWWQVAGYFYYYGHYYAALCIEQLPPGARAAHRRRLAEILLPLQETDGSWWDYPLYDYHYAWGTAMALMALQGTRK